MSLFGVLHEHFQVLVSDLAVAQVFEDASEDLVVHIARACSRRALSCVSLVCGWSQPVRFESGSR